MTRKGSIMRTRETAGLPELESMLTLAAARRARESKAGGGRRVAGARISHVAAVGLVCLAFGGTAMAASGVWDPIIGSPSDPVTLSDTPVPAALIAQLGVLRRDQTPQDRSAAVEATLKGGELPDGVRLDSVRYLAPGPNGEATILLSGLKAAPYETEDEPLCVARPFPGIGRAASLCFGLSMLMSDHARASQVDVASDTGTAYGLVPDGVATVTAKFGSAPDVTVPVADNYWEIPLSGAELSNAHGEASVQRTVWRDANGNVVPQQSQQDDTSLANGRHG